MQWSNLPKAPLCFYQPPVCRFPTSSTKPTTKAVVSVIHYVVTKVAQLEEIGTVLQA